MSDLYRISIDDKTGATVRGRIHVVHPDAEEIPPERDFALKMVIEIWHRMREGYFFTHPRFPDRPPFELSRGAEIAEGLAVRDELQRFWDLDRGRHVVLTAAEVEEIHAAGKIRDKKEKAAATRRLMDKHGVKRLGIGLLNGEDYLTGERDPEAFFACAREVVTEYRVGERQSWPPYWAYDDEDIEAFEAEGFDEFDEPFDIKAFKKRRDRGALEDYPFAEFTFTVADARYIEHIRGGIHLATAIYGEFGW